MHSHAERGNEMVASGGRRTSKYYAFPRGAWERDGSKLAHSIVDELVFELGALHESS